MAASPCWKVYSPEGEYLAATKRIDDAAILVSHYGAGATIRSGHVFIVWTEGLDGWGSESYDVVAEHVAKKLKREV